MKHKEFLLVAAIMMGGNFPRGIYVRHRQGFIDQKPIGL